MKDNKYYRINIQCCDMIGDWGILPLCLERRWGCIWLCWTFWRVASPSQCWCLMAAFWHKWCDFCHWNGSHLWGRNASKTSELSSRLQRRSDDILLYAWKGPHDVFHDIVVSIWSWNHIFQALKNNKCPKWGKSDKKTLLFQSQFFQWTGKCEIWNSVKWQDFS